MKSFIETQFPISRLSAESYKERKANLGQTLTGLGKWWGRKPLILVRACILGMLMPASSDASKDREIFLKLLTMDDDGVWRRRKAAIPDRVLLEAAPDFQDAWKTASKEEREELREEIWESLNEVARFRLDALRRFAYTRSQFNELSYEERIKNCVRPEHMDGPDESAWVDINTHLGTTASSLAEIVEQLGVRRFGHRPRVGDCFAGGGSIPFEAARIGCEAFGSDLNPVAAFLTWAGLNLVGGGKAVQTEVHEAQEIAFASAQEQIDEWGIERSEEGWEAEAYLYCVEVRPEGYPYYIPLAPSWLIGERTRVVARLVQPGEGDRIGIEILTDPDAETWKSATSGVTGTVKNGRVISPFHSELSWSIDSLRGPNGLRLWEKTDLVPRLTDVFQERLYCIRWRKPDGTREYRAPTNFDLCTEAKVSELLLARLDGWWQVGFVPSKMIDSGYNTDQPIRERGWTHWHHLFTPRQLLVNGLVSERMNSRKVQPYSFCVVSRMADWNSRLSVWMNQKGNEKGNQVFANQALNTQFNFSCRPLNKLATSKIDFGYSEKIDAPARIALLDARSLATTNDLWITDPPYADAINYHELADFFLAWYEKLLPKAFPEWVPDGRKALAVRGTGEDFKKSMVEIYTNLCKHMPDNGLQMVQFTHQNPSVWADLGMILWASGLRVTAAWTVATETPAGGIKKGNYVQGTVLLVLRKRTESEHGFLDEVYPLVEDEVKHQIDSMRALDEGNDPNFGDTDYQLAAYAAALRVLTQYQTLDGQDIKHELFRVQKKGQAKTRFEQVIDRAISIACDYLVPRGLDNIWRELSAHERLYLRALDVESRGEHRQGVYQELARGFGVGDYKNLLSSTKANLTRLANPSEFARRDLGGEGFAGSVLRHLLYAVFATVRDDSPEAALRYLKDELRDYWSLRQRLIALLEWIGPVARIEGMEHWSKDCEAAQLLAGRLRNDHA